MLLQEKGEKTEKMCSRRIGISQMLLQKKGKKPQKKMFNLLVDLAKNAVNPLAKCRCKERKVSFPGEYVPT